MQAIKKAYENYFLTGRNALDLGIGRILFYGFLLYYYLSDQYFIRFIYMGKLQGPLWKPVSFFQYFSLEGLSLLCSYSTVGVFVVSLLFCTLGLFFRLSSVVAFISALIVIGMPNNFGTIYDSTTLVCVILFVLCFCEASRYFSLDRRFNLIKEGESSKNIWGLNLISSLVFFFYFCSGIQKVRLGGLGYYSTQDLSMALVYNQAPLGKELLTLAGLEKFLKISGVMLQLSAIIPLLYKPSRTLFAIFFLIFHLSVDFAMTVHFSTFKIIYVFLFPWFGFLKDIRYLLGKKPIDFNEGFPSKPQFSLVNLCVALFVFLGSSLSVLTYHHYWPFSTTTMYSYSEKFPYDEFNVFIRLKGDQHYRLLEDPDFFPLDRVKTQLAIRNHLKQKRPIMKVALATYQMLLDYHGDDLQGMEIKHCFYPDLENLIQLYPRSSDCELLSYLEE